jgi:hypothetical protein
LNHALQAGLFRHALLGPAQGLQSAARKLALLARLPDPPLAEVDEADDVDESKDEKAAAPVPVVAPVVPAVEETVMMYVCAAPCAMAEAAPSQKSSQPVGVGYQMVR